MCKLVVLGSQALNKRLEVLGLPEKRNPKDLDVLASLEVGFEFAAKRLGSGFKMRQGRKSNKFVFSAGDSHIELEATETTHSQKLFEAIVADADSLEEGDLVYPSLDVLYMLKMSHKFLKNSPHFEKTRADILYLESLGCSISDRYVELFKEREALTYDYSLPNLAVSKNEFFTMRDVYVYDHDSIHEAVALGEKPAYLSFKPVDKAVWCDKGMFEACSFEVQLNALMEESYVLALERAILPAVVHQGKSLDSVNSYWAFKQSLKNICTHITSGWFRDFAWKHFEVALSKYDNTYAQRFFELAQKGKVEPYVKPG